MRYEALGSSFAVCWNRWQIPSDGTPVTCGTGAEQKAAGVLECKCIIQMMFPSHEHACFWRLRILLNKECQGKKKNSSLLKVFGNFIFHSFFLPVCTDSSSWVPIHSSPSLQVSTDNMVNCSVPKEWINFLFFVLGFFIFIFNAAS